MQTILITEYWNVFVKKLFEKKYRQIRWCIVHLFMLLYKYLFLKLKITRWTNLNAKVFSPPFIILDSKSTTKIKYSHIPKHLSQGLDYSNVVRNINRTCQSRCTKLTPALYLQTNTAKTQMLKMRPTSWGWSQSRTILMISELSSSLCSTTIR